MPYHALPPLPRASQREAWGAVKRARLSEAGELARTATPAQLQRPLDSLADCCEGVHLSACGHACHYQCHKRYT